MAQQIAEAARAFQHHRTGRVPPKVTVVLCGDTLVITLGEALSPVEQALAQSPSGAAQVQEFHRQLFATSCETLCQEIKRITGVAVCEAAAEVETAAGTVVQAIANGTMVQMFLLAQSLPESTWKSNSSGASLASLPALRSEEKA
jgi:uncharacterized protein YbcI